MVNLKAKPSPKKILRLLVAAILIGIVGSVTISLAVFPSENSEDNNDISKNIAALTVTTSALRSLMWDDTIKASGPLVAWQESSISAQLSGQRLIEVLVDVGDEVTSGQVLARFDPSTLLNEKKLLTANLAQAKALASQAELDFVRAEKLSVDGGISQQAFLQAKTAKETTSAQLELAQAQLSANQLQLRYVNVTAPDSGVISSRSATPGAVGAIGQELFRLIRGNKIEWQGELTALQAKQISIGQKVKLSLPNGNSANAYIRQIAPTLDPQSRMQRVYASIDPGSDARLGMFAEGSIRLPQRPAIVASSESVVIRDGRSYIFILPSDSMAVIQKPVQVARRQGNLVEIVGNVAIGEMVVEKGAGFLNDGDVVRVVANVHSQEQEFNEQGGVSNE